MKLSINGIRYSKDYKVAIFDFDGVIKDSIDAKGTAYQEIFEKATPKQKNYIKHHHLQNGGISRYDKIPLYMKLLEINPTKESIDYYLDKFQRRTVEKVLCAEWIDGAYEFLERISTRCPTYIATATPTKEMITILKGLNIYDILKGSFGSPAKKNEIIRQIIINEDVHNNEVIFFGDSQTDREAAELNDVDFVLVNGHLDDLKTCLAHIPDFGNESIKCH